MVIKISFLLRILLSCFVVCGCVVLGVHPSSVCSVFKKYSSLSLDNVVVIFYCPLL